MNAIIAHIKKIIKIKSQIKQEDLTEENNKIKITREIIKLKVLLQIISKV